MVLPRQFSLLYLLYNIYLLVLYISVTIVILYSMIYSNVSSISLGVTTGSF
jgi:hypothetical protein